MKPILGLSRQLSIPTWVHDAGVWAMANSGVSPQSIKRTNARINVFIIPTPCLWLRKSEPFDAGKAARQPLLASERKYRLPILFHVPPDPTGSGRCVERLV